MRPEGETFAGWAILAVLAAAPWLVAWLGQPFLMDLAIRLIIVAIAAVSLNLILGYGGMVSFGHAAFFGIGAYAIGIPAYYEDMSWITHLGAVVVFATAFAVITGVMSLRTRGVHFIMITMAFAQMCYFLFVSLEEYGADDGLNIWERTQIPFLDLEDNLTFYYVCLGALILSLFIVHRIVNARFGQVIQGARSNDRRMQALGFPTFRYRLVAYVIAGLMCAFAGALEANRNYFISPDMMDWTRSGEFIFMVVLGGTARLYGPLFGVVIFIVLEEYLEVLMDAISPGLGIYWHLPFGLLLILVVLFVRGGISGLMGSRRA
ncbi:MAG: branched-chain amino acid ABC transporter permease [Pseudomonadota bacterium]